MKNAPHQNRPRAQGIAVEINTPTARLEELFRAHVGLDAEPLRTITTCVGANGENMEVGVSVFREHGRPPRRRWYAWLLPQLDRMVFLAVPRGHGIRNARHAVGAGLGMYLCEPAKTASA